MNPRYIRLLLICLAIVIGAIFSYRPVFAEGEIFYGGYGQDYAKCGSTFLPCQTYDYTRRQACNRSENERTTYHIFHVIDGYVSSCDMVGGAGYEPRAVIERNWRGLFLSALFPTLGVFMITLIGVTLYYRRKSSTP